MSRAFVKEHDDDPEQPLTAPPRIGPYYVTPEGLEQLKASLEQAKREGRDRDVEALERKIEAAVVPEAAAVDKGVVAFGSTVTIEVQKAAAQTYRIVGEDEADPLHGTISWQSPLARAMLDHRAGDRVVWQRPAGNVAVRILSISK